MRGWYYLHQNSDLIFRKFRPEEDSSFVQRVWPLNTEDRATAWIILIEALALGARRERVDELATLWGCDDRDAQLLVEHARYPDGTPVFRLYKDGDAWCATFHDFIDLQSSQAGFGDTCLEALADLAGPGLRARKERNGNYYEN